MQGERKEGNGDGWAGMQDPEKREAGHFNSCVERDLRNLESMFWAVILGNYFYSLDQCLS